MTYKQFENIVSARRMERYLIACYGDTQKARRLYHHEPICFTHDNDEVDLSYAKAEYNRIIKLFAWMQIDSKSLFGNLDKVQTTFSQIEKLK